MRAKPRAPIERTKQKQSRHGSVALAASFAVPIRIRVPADLEGLQCRLVPEQRLCFFNAAESRSVMYDPGLTAGKKVVGQRVRSPGDWVVVAVGRGNQHPRI